MDSLPHLEPPRSAYASGVLGAVGTLLGVVLSGPIAVMMVASTHPQPPWSDARTFVDHFHPVQVLPYLGGTVLVTALVLLMASIHGLALENQKPWTVSGLVFTSVFAAFIFFNYVVQTTFLPELARHYERTDALLVTTLSMSNPTSLAWALEMWGWGFLGAATLLVAPTFRGSRLERGAAFAFRANGMVSLVGTAWTVMSPGWVMTSAGLVAFGLWNALLATMAALALAVFSKRARGGLPAPERGTRAGGHAGVGPRPLG